MKGGESEWFRTYRGVRQGCIMSPWLLNKYLDRKYGREDRDKKKGSEIPEGGRECRLPGLLYADDFFLGVES